MESSSSQRDHSLPRASDLLQTKPFEPFLEFSRADASAFDDRSRDWFEHRLQEGKPFIIRGYKGSPHWNGELLNTNRLVDLLKNQEVDFQHCLRNRSSKAPFQNFIAQHRSQENEPLYARDIDCPKEWNNAIESIVSKRLWHLGPSDLARHLPRLAQSDVVMVHVGARGSFTGFHWADSGAVFLSLMPEFDGGGPGSIWFAADRQSSAKYDRFVESLGKSPHTNWSKLTPEQLCLADFPIYVVEQYPGDMVVFPSGSPHQVINLGKLVTTVALNILHSSSVYIFNDYLEPKYNQICHEDISRMPMIPRYTLQRACDGFFDLRNAHNLRDVELMLDIFAAMVYEERLPNGVTVETEPSSDVFTCSFCEAVIWNRHLHCAKCPDFDLCLKCFINGRSCKYHYGEYSFKQLMPAEACQGLINATEAKIGRRTWAMKPRVSLGELAAQAMKDRRNNQPTVKGCHMCLCRHETGATMQCTKCTKNYCLRNFVRHFEIDLIPFLKERHGQTSWECPWCTQTCSCPHCNFPQRYKPTGKFLTCRAKIPPGLRRGFTDVQNPLAPKKPDFGFNEPTVSPRKRPRLEERKLDEVNHDMANQTPLATQGWSRRPRRVIGNRQSWQLDSPSEASSRRNVDNNTVEYVYSEASDDDSSDSSDQDQSQEIKAEPSSSPVPASQLPEPALEADTVNVDPSLAMHAANPHNGVPFHALDMDSVATSISPSLRPAIAAPVPRNAALGHHASLGSSASRPATANAEGSSHQLIANSTHRPYIPPHSTQPLTRHAATALTIPPTQASMSPAAPGSKTSLVSKKADLQWLRGCVKFAIEQDNTPFQEKLNAEITKVEAAIEERQTMAKAMFQRFQDDGLHELAAEARKYCD